MRRERLYTNRPDRSCSKNISVRTDRVCQSVLADGFSFFAADAYIDVRGQRLEVRGQMPENRKRGFHGISRIVWRDNWIVTMKHTKNSKILLWSKKNEAKNRNHGFHGCTQIIRWFWYKMATALRWTMDECCSHKMNVSFLYPPQTTQTVQTKHIETTDFADFHGL